MKCVRRFLIALVLIFPVVFCAEAFAAQGYWRLQEIKPEAEGVRSGDNFTHTGVVTTSDAKLHTDMIYRGSKGDVTVVASWAGPPEILLPGQNIRLSGSISITQMHQLPVGRLDYALRAERGNQRVYWYGISVATDGKANAAGSGELLVRGVDEEGGHLNIVIRMEIGKNDWKGSVSYIYNWVAGPPPAGAGTIKTTSPATGGASPTVSGSPASTGSPTSTGSAGSAKSGAPLAPCPTNVSSQTVQVCSVTARPGETVNIPVWLIAGRDLANVNVNLSYDASVAQASGKATKGGQLGQALFESNLAQSGLARFGFAGSLGISGNGQVATIPFKVTGKPGQRTPLTLRITTANSASGAQAQVAALSGELVVVGDAGSGATGTTGTTGTQGTTGKTGTTGTTGTQGTTGNTGATGTKGTTGTTGTGSSGLPSGKFSAMDAMAALKMSVGLLPLDMKYDVDKNGQVTSGDARLILMNVVGK
jgi:hypothetical protein